MTSESILQSGEDRAVSNSDSLYSGSGKDSASPKGLFKSKKARKGFIVTFISIALMGGGAAFLGTSNSTLVGAITNLLTEQLNPQHADASRRTRFLFTRILKGEAKLSDSMKKNLEKNDFTVTKQGNGYSLTYKDGSVITADNLNKTLNSNVELRSAYDQSVKSKAFGFYDNKAVKNKARYNITNNKLKDYTETNNAEDNKKRMDEILAPDYENNKTEIGGTTAEKEEVKDADGKPVLDKDGNPTYKEVPEMKDPATSDKVDSSPQVSEAATSNARSYISKVASTAGSVANGVCTALRIGSMLSAAVTGYQAAQSMMFAMNYLESYSKAQAGDGDTSGVNVASNFLSTSTSEKITDISKVNPLSGQSEDENVIILTGAPLASPSLSSVLSKTSPKMSSSLQKSLGLDKVLLGALGTVGLTKAQYSMCEGITAIQAVVSITLSAGLGSLVASTFISATAGSLIDHAISAAFAFAIPIIAKDIFSNNYTTTRGIPAGEEIVQGTNKTASMIGRTSSGQVLATEEYALEYAKLTQEVIAQDAEVERYTHSPFDVTSQYTFLGSIVHSLLPIVNSTRQNTLSNISTIVNQSLTTITGTSAYAAGTKNSSYLTTFGDNCERLGTIGATCTILSDDIVVSDTSTINLDVSEGSEAYETYIKPNLDDDGKIKEKSDLAKFINYVTLRESEFGYADANIAGELDIVPAGLGDIADIVNGIHNLTDPDVKSWIYGDYGVICNDRWGEFKVYQRWVADQRYLEWLGDDSTTINAYNEFIDNRIAQVTADDSFAGILSRISGLSKSDAEFVIALGEYYQYLDGYDTSSVIALAETTYNPSLDEVVAKAQHDKMFHQNPHRSQTTLAILVNSISYTDLRNRNYLT